MFKKKVNTKVHFIGIGGIGMSGIAEILLHQGYSVSGSDVKEGQVIEQLRRSGATVFIGHRAENIHEASVVVYSSAIDKENPEMVAAMNLGLPVIRRAEMLSELMRLKYGLAVAGTHGKTTTSSLLATLLKEAKLNPTFIIGGIVENLGGQAQVGQGDFLVAEADESDGSFLLLGPILSVITNIDDDHLDYYQGRENLLQAFADFANKVPFYGACALNVHDEWSCKIREKIKRPVLLFGILDHQDGSLLGRSGEGQIDYGAKNISYGLEFTEYDLYFKGVFAQRMRIYLHGEHNVLNSLGAIALAHQLDISFAQMSQGIQKFRGVGRRFQHLYKREELEIIDDYAHHPTEVLATLKAAKQLRGHKVYVVFEPHRYSRTEICWQKFLHCFNYADSVFVAPIYAAGEKNRSGITSERLVEDINALHPGLAHYLPSLDELPQFIKSLTPRPLTLLTLGAGSIGKRVREAIKELP